MLEALERFTEQVLSPLAIEGFASMNQQAEEISTTQSAERLTPVQVMVQLLGEVKSWTQHLLDEESRRIEARCPFLAKLLCALIVMKVKVLSCLNMRETTESFPLTVPSNHTFIHSFYIHAARMLAEQPALIADMRMATMGELLRDALRCAAFDCIRWDELLAWGLDGVNPSDALRRMFAASERRRPPRWRRRPLTRKHTTPSGRSTTTTNSIAWRTWSRARRRAAPPR